MLALGLQLKSIKQ